MDMETIKTQWEQVDAELAGLLRRRIELAGELAVQRRAAGLPPEDPLEQRRELEQLRAGAPEPMDMYLQILGSVLQDLQRSYITVSGGEHSALTDRIRLAVERTPKVFPRRGTIACQGIEGAYSQLACDKLFALPNILYFKNFEGVFKAVQEGVCDYGVLPIENSSNGSVNKVYDLMHDYRFSIVRSVKLHVDHNLLVLPGVRPEEIREVVSHEQAIGQCSAFLAAHPEIRVTVCENTAVAARLVAQSGRRDLAAISSHNCAGLYGLTIASDRIQNSENNYTRFICIARELEIYPGADRISLMVSAEHRPGSLYRMIAKFAALGLNLTKIESRPIVGRDFEFLFYFDLEASVWSPEVMSLLADCSRGDERFTFLGSYSEI